MNIGFKRNGVNFIFQNPDDKAFYHSLNYLNEHNNIIIKGAGVNHAEFDYVKPILKEKLIVVFSGRMLLDKGLVEFMEATRILKDKFYNKVEFILMGDIDINNKASVSLDLIQEYSFEGYLTWLGHQENVKSILIKSDIVCLPSYREGLPKALIEAMAIGRPIITTDAPGCRECVDDNLNGFLVPVKSVSELANKLDILLSDELLRLNMGIASRNKMVKELSLQNVINETKVFYKKTLND
jgi:glycosyltransferase involved in cell wall biosynthesis